MGVFAALLGIAGQNVGGLLVGSAIGGVAEAALPWLTRFHQLRKARRMAREIRRQLRGSGSVAADDG